MMKQYLSFKDQYPEKLLLFRMGDFYEMFGDDAKLAARILNITLTSRDKGKNNTPMAGFPYHALPQYLPKIIEAGESAVIVEQAEDPKQAKGLVKRAVTRVITPGTLDGDLASEVRNSYLMALYSQKKQLGVGLMDISTGEFRVAQLPHSSEMVQRLISSYAPSEILIVDNEKGVSVRQVPVQIMESYVAQTSERDSIIKKFYGIENLNSIGLEGTPLASSAAAMLLHYMQETQRMDPDHIEIPQIFSLEGTMVLDNSTIRNLDLVANSYSGQVQESLLGVLDDTKTPMGKRGLYSWILNPLIDDKQIKNRLDVVEELLSQPELLAQAREALSNIADIERLVGKIGLNRANGRDLRAIHSSLESAQQLHELLKGSKKITKQVDLKGLLKQKGLDKASKLIDSAIHEEPPINIMDGGMIKDGYNKEVDELRSVSGNSKDWVNEFAAKEKESTGIPSLRIGFNRVFGYYIEVTKVHQDKVPEHYVRKQTLVNSERYITDELKQKEDVILGAEEKLSALEYKLFQEIRDQLLPQLDNMKLLSREIAKLDILSGFAQIAREFAYTRPTIHPMGSKDGTIKIVGGRHPIVERLAQEDFVSNDTNLKMQESRMCIITGPNMSGKSTFIRQVASLVLMAQIGSFIPAQSSEIAIADRIFSRVGASDDLSQGRSTFMVEMEEAANILNNATEHSLVILDEVGRGTSTYDGVSIAWALSEYLVEKIKARTLFATHYHELLQLAQEHPDVVKNYNVHVKESDQEVIFLRKIVEGGTDRSYGIYVAKLAGLPAKVIKRANVILGKLELDRGDSRAKGKASSTKDIGQISFWAGGPAPQEDGFKEELQDIDINSLTPVEALNLLQELVKKAKE